MGKLKEKGRTVKIGSEPVDGVVAPGLCTTSTRTATNINRNEKQVMLRKEQLFS